MLQDFLQAQFVTMRADSAIKALAHDTEVDAKVIDPTYPAHVGLGATRCEYEVPLFMWLVTVLQSARNGLGKLITGDDLLRFRSRRINIRQVGGAVINLIR